MKIFTTITQFLTCIACILAFCPANAQTGSSVKAKFEYHLWPDGAPSSNGITEPEEGNPMFVVKVTDPILTVYVPQNPNGLAVIACPGGSYCQVWQGTEGHNMADWYTAQGVTYAVLKYRLPNGGHYQIPMEDVHRAMAIMKEHKADYPFSKLGIQGCSAGGHLASTAATHYSTETRPDFQILFYPVISFNPEFTHMDTRNALIGNDPSEELIKLYSNELQVKDDAPPAIILSSSDDGLVPVRNSVEYYNALLAHGASVTMLLYPTGGHGWFGNPRFDYREAWLQCLATWLNQQAK